MNYVIFPVFFVKFKPIEIYEIDFIKCAFYFLSNGNLHGTSGNTSWVWGHFWYGFMGLGKIFLGFTNLRERYLVIYRVGKVSYGVFDGLFRSLFTYGP